MGIAIDIAWKVHDITSIAKAFLHRLVDVHGESFVRKALARWSWQVTTTFTGAGFAEVALENLADAARTFLGPASTTGPSFVSWGRACDNSKACQRLLVHRFGTSRCIFDDILGWAEENWNIEGCPKPGRPPKCDLTLGSHASCVSHGGQCPLHSWHTAPKVLDRMLLELAGPPCPPFSRFGSKRGCRDARFRGVT